MDAKRVDIEVVGRPVKESAKPRRIAIGGTTGTKQIAAA